MHPEDGSWFPAEVLVPQASTWSSARPEPIPGNVCTEDVPASGLEQQGVHHSETRAWVVGKKGLQEVTEETHSGPVLCAQVASS